MKMTEFRSQQPLSDDDFVSIRRNVMTAVARRRQLPMAMRFALAAAVVIAIGLAFLARRPAAPVAITVTLPPPVIKTVPPPIVAAVAPPPQIARVAHRPHRHRAPRAILARQNIRLEFRTSDPDVRIIWIASQTPTSTGGKS